MAAHGPQSHTTCIQTSALSPSSFVSLNKLLNISEFQFLFQQKGYINNIHLQQMLSIEYIQSAQNSTWNSVSSLYMFTVVCTVSGKDWDQLSLVQRPITIHKVSFALLQVRSVAFMIYLEPKTERIQAYCLKQRCGDTEEQDYIHFIFPHKRNDLQTRRITPCMVTKEDRLKVGEERLGEQLDSLNKLKHR